MEIELPPAWELSPSPPNAGRRVPAGSRGSSPAGAEPALVSRAVGEEQQARALELAGCRPEECFFTDDIPDYIEGAKRAGIDAVQFQSGEQIEAELRARGVL